MYGTVLYDVSAVLHRALLCPAVLSALYVSSVSSRVRCQFQASCCVIRYEYFGAGSEEREKKERLIEREKNNGAFLGYSV